MQAAGCVYPISDVAGDNASHFMDASQNGDDVFIATADQLVPADTDTRVDVYDVRVEGGFPVVVPPPACTNGDSCKGPAAAQPGVFGAPASATFSGSENATLTSTPATAVKQKPKTAAQVRAEKLKQALKVCKRKAKSKRKGCEAQAKKKYGKAKASKAKASKSSGRRSK
jgi:hypothetical protein